MSDPQAPSFSADDAQKLVEAVDGGHLAPKDLSDEGALAYNISKGTVKRDDLSPSGQALFDQIQPPPDHSTRDAVVDVGTKTADLLGMAGGAMAGAGAGALTSPVTGPVGPVAGAVGGAGLGYAAAHQIGHIIKSSMGIEPAGDLAENTANTAKAVGEGAKMQLYGEGAGALMKGGIDAAKGVYPYFAKFLGGVPKPIGRMLAADTTIPEKFSGTAEAVSGAVEDLQNGLKSLKQKASEVYSATLEQLGIGGPKTASEAALKLTGPANLKVLPPEDIGSAYLKMIQEAPSKPDLDNLRTAATISKSINENLKFAKAGQNVTPISDDLSPTLNKVKDGVKDFLDKLPGGDALNKANEQWAAMHKIYDTLQPHLKDVGEATKWLKNVISDEGTGSATSKALLSAVDEATGQPLFDTAAKHIASSILKQPMGDTLVGKLGMMAAASHPSRLVGVPATLAVQSPLAQTRVLQGLARAGDTIAANPHVTGSMLEALREGGKALSGPSETKDLMDRPDD